MIRILMVVRKSAPGISRRLRAGEQADLRSVIVKYMQLVFENQSRETRASSAGNAHRRRLP